MTAADTAKSRWWQDSANQHVIRAIGAAVPVVCVNATAFIGQFSFVHDHVKWILAGQVLFAATLETVAVYLAWQAHLAKKADDTSLRLTLAAYLFAGVVGTMNYSHFAGPHWRPTFMAAAMAAMSLMSPVLWGVHTRRTSRDELKTKGLIEDHAVRLGGTRWTWHLVRSMRVMWWATWHGINDPRRAIAHFASRYGAPAELFQDLARALAREERAMLAGILLAQEDAPAASVPGSAPADDDEPVPFGAAVAQVLEAVPAAVPEAVPAAVTSQAAEALDAGGSLVTGPDGPQVGISQPQVLSATAVLEADANLSGGRPSQEVVDAAEMVLMATPLDGLPSIRAVARDLLGDANQRRLAAKLLADRKAAGSSFAPAPAPGQDAGNGTMIAAPLGFQPGGVNG